VKSLKFVSIHFFRNFWWIWYRQISNFWKSRSIPFKVI